MNKQKSMSEEVFDEIIDNFEVFGKLTLWGRRNIKYHVKRLQEENSHLKKILDTMGLDANKIIYLEKENKELKETLKGTTYCFDEEEHQRLIKENEELKEQYNRLLKENFGLKQRPVLTEFEKWLEEQKLSYIDGNFIVIRLVDVKNKLQELKEGRK